MRIRRIAILIDGGFFIKRLSKLVEAENHATPEAVAESPRVLCKRHVQQLMGEAPDTKPSRWLDHVYRLFYYEAKPYDGTAHNPISNVAISFGRIHRFLATAEIDLRGSRLARHLRRNGSAVRAALTEDKRVPRLCAERICRELRIPKASD